VFCNKIESPSGSQDEKMNPRINSPQRDQLCLDVLDYDQLIPIEHEARIIVAFVEQLNLQTFYADIKSVPGVAGRSATDPRLLLCLWLYATVQGIGSARLLEKQCEREAAYRWICGGVKVNYHTLSDFRVEQGEKLDELLTDIVSSLISKELVQINTVLQDGTKIKASAGKGSFKRKGKLSRLKKDTGRYIKQLRKELEADPALQVGRLEAARLSAKERVAKKIEQALAELPKVEAIKEERKKKVKKGTEVKEAKVSTTDPAARIMKFADKSYRAGYNCQVAIDPKSYVVLGLEVTQRNNDSGLLKPMIEQLESRYGVRPKRALVDSHYCVKQDIVDLAENGKKTLVYSPLPKKKENIKKENQVKRQKKEAKDPPAYKSFCQRMENKITQKYYKMRSRIETVNGIFHNRLPMGFRLRGLGKVKAELLLQAISHNILRSWTLSQA
jgi:transposase